MPKMDVNILIHKYLTGQISAGDQARLDEWLATDPRNQETLDEIQTIWEGADYADEQISDSHFSEELKKLEGAVGASKRKDSLVKQSQRRAKALGMMSVLAILAAVAFALWPAFDRQAAGPMRFSNSKFDKVVLEDGSAVLMNDSSTIDYQQDRSERTAMLSGEAMFEVRREERPFKIKTADAQVEVLGTSFVVKAYPGKPTQVIVISGKVKVRAAEKELLLTAGEMTTILGNLTRKSPNENPNFNSWYTGVLEFRNEPLGQVLKELEDQFDVRFIVDKPQILSCGFTGKFENAKLEDVLRALSYSLNLQFDRKDQRTLIAKGDGCTQ